MSQSKVQQINLQLQRITELTGYGYHNAIAVALCVLYINIYIYGKKFCRNEKSSNFFQLQNLLTTYKIYTGGAKLLSVVTSASYCRLFEKINLINNFEMSSKVTSNGGEA